MIVFVAVAGCSSGLEREDEVQRLHSEVELGDIVVRETVIEANPVHDADVIEDMSDAPPPPPRSTDSDPPVVCGDGGPPDDPVQVRWDDVLSPDSVSVLADGLIAFSVVNTTDIHIDASVYLLVSNGFSSVEHALALSPLSLDPGEESIHSVDLRAAAIDDAAVISSQNAVLRVEYVHPEVGATAYAFSPTAFFHTAEDGIVAYGQDALTEQFAGGDLLDTLALSPIDDAVLLGVFISN